MNYAEIKYCDIANGPGVRTSLFVSGCTHRCRNCFNEIAWDFGYGEPFTKEVAERIYQSCQAEYYAGITLLGGEPMEPENQRALVPFVKEFRRRYPRKTVWCYSGYTYEALTGQTESRSRCEVTDEFLTLLDVLVDGPYVEELHDLTLRFRGSSNQRLIDMPGTLAGGRVILWRDDPLFESHQLRK
ncbi:MAG: anaerobic ribonucleoside-triphosphate reductase activating protein [Lachnospiraceae bacterium]|nr:anaerobic ribonucleoside-triphosphate reductase activating protein [Lachnospiraceae bacterium]MDD7024203.1 anaerobic ribonucleoside-triphosphate reductase activating protein [Oscillospiraceae bacterium]MDY5649359.1 anaerobic ribonucleoside-triphosphate reductase activating protein [Lachnospiraceae bacterium]